MMFSLLRPNDIYSFAHAIADEPAPDITNLTLFIFLFTKSIALINAAQEIIAVPC